MRKTTVDERRSNPRIDTTLPLQVTPEEGGIVARMKTENLSLDGLYCTSNSDFPEMTRLAVRLMLPLLHCTNGETEPVDLEAVVVRREEVDSATGGNARFKLALFFTGVDDEDRERLAAYLKKR